MLVLKRKARKNTWGERHSPVLYHFNAQLPGTEKIENILFDEKDIESWHAIVEHIGEEEMYNIVKYVSPVGKIRFEKKGDSRYKRRSSPTTATKKKVEEMLIANRDGYIGGFYGEGIWDLESAYIIIRNFYSKPKERKKVVRNFHERIKKKNTELEEFIKKLREGEIDTESKYFTIIMEKGREIDDVIEKGEEIFISSC